jgi:pimeloyl-ACP methyl ester carboxylesterase
MLLACSVTALTQMSAPPAEAHSDKGKSHKNPPLVLSDEGSFFINGKVENTQFPTAGSPAPGKTIVNQMYVRYMIPDKVRQYTTKSGKKTVKTNVPPVIMIHGSGHTGATFETTPDGREGWATYFLRQGFPVYIVDHSGRARSGFDPNVINQAKVDSNPAILPSIVKTTLEGAWVGFRIGPEYGVAYPGTQFPTAQFEHYAAQLVPNTEVTLAGGGNNSTDAMVALLDKIGPAIIIAHSQGSTYGAASTVQRPNLVKGLVLLEGSCAATPTEITSAFVRSPYMAIIGDNRPSDRNVQCQTAVSSINSAGGNAKFWLLPDSGMKGNTHMMMMDKNSDLIANKLLTWLTSNIK